jgi:hypothetical protein
MPLELSGILRQLVIDRAGNRCEYCLLPQKAAFHKHEPDHIVPLQHGGETIETNLALACMRCNRYKGSNVGSIDPLTGKLVPFFNPRIHDWKEHFELEEAVIRPLTPEARVTVKILRLNDEDRVMERMRLLEVGLYQAGK